MRYVFIVLCLTACAAERQPGDLFGSVGEDSELVVDGVLLVDHALPEMFVRRTLPPSQAYRREAAVITDAEVRIFQGDQVFEYATRPGFARPLSATARGPPSRVPDRVPAGSGRRGQEGAGEHHHTGASAGTAGRCCWTKTPKRSCGLSSPFAEVGDDVYTAPENQITYLDGLLEFHLNTVAVAGYQAAIFALDEDPQLADEDLGDFYDEEDADALRVNQSPPLAISDGIVRWPWFAVAFTGRSLIKVYAVDHNWFEYARSSPDQQEQGGFGGMAGDNFERPFFQVEGGIGLFGSASVDSVGLSSCRDQAESSD